MAHVSKSSGRYGDSVGELLKDLKCEIGIMDDKIEQIDTLIHKVENEAYLDVAQASSHSGTNNYIKSFNNSMFEIKQNVKKCERRLRFSNFKVQDVLRRRMAPNAGTTVTAVGKGPAAADVSSVGAEDAVLNQNYEEERRFREIELTIQYFQEQLKEAVDKLKGYISRLQNKSIHVASW